MEWLRFLRRVTGRPLEAPPEPTTVLAEKIESANAFARLNSQLPLKDASGQHSFVRREAVLNRAERVAGYEFTLMTRLRTRMTRRGGTATRAYDAALLARMTMHDVSSLLGSRLAFISLSIESLDNETIDRLPRTNTVLTFEMTRHATDWDALTREFARLKEKGFCHGVHIFDAADVECPLIAESEFIQIDVTAFDGLDLRSLARRLKHMQTNGRPTPRLIAREVQSDDDYQLCYKAGFDLFQGPFVSSRDSLRPTHNAINRMAALPVLAMLRTDRNYSEIANQLKNEPILSYKLLRYLNSAAIGMPQHVDNLTQALVVLGRDKFYRWTSLLLFDIENPGYRERLLSERALTRGRSLELLAGMGRIPRLPDQLFLIGLFSLLDQALDRPLPELVVKAALPDVVRDALLGCPGPCTDALALVVLAEADTRTHPDLLAGALDACAIDDRDFSPIAAAALVWADHVLDVGTA